MSNNHLNVSKVVGIQFSLMSPQEIRNSSVLEITSKEVYESGKPVVNGLFDARMGVLEPGMICPTDGLTYMQSPGYFGRIELSRPVFYVQHLTTIQKILKCVCFQCSKLLVSKNKYRQALKMSNSQRWDYVSDLCKGVKRCGDDSDDGCGCKQPVRIKHEAGGMIGLIAEWESGRNQAPELFEIQLTPELVLKIFKRIPDDDITFMGFSPLWSRPEWMICQVLAVPPPAVRPSVKHDAQQHSEDDLTHLLVSILKTNKTLLEKIQNNAPQHVITGYTNVLQYYIGSMVDNKLNPVTQRSGRPFKSIKDRLSTKQGRMRGNLMAKRVDFSARSVITADPNISIRELGVPLKIAKNITKPVTVNDRNKAFLTQLVRNGPDVWPGAKILERKEGKKPITLRYLDRNSLVLQNGDVVHRHMMNGDPVLFNRQPTLHRMSMMCHLARIMKQGETFRMNVADTKPYNADFDGDEMNLHMPQDPESESELMRLAAVPYQIISPTNNASIIGIYQDSMLGADRFTRPDVRFSKMEAMNLLMMFSRADPSRFPNPLQKEAPVSNFDLLSQIMPPLTLKLKNKQFNADKEKAQTSNNVVEIVNGKYLRGQIDKGVLGSGTKGIIHRICNDFGNMMASNFIDDFQNIITEYMKQSSFSVGISDLITDKQTNQNIVNIISSKRTEVEQLIDQVRLGVFENNSGRSNEEEFETRVNNILSKAQNDAGREALKSLSKDNRFVIMFNAGSKGSEINIQQMTACLGQQGVGGGRIPYGFDHRTLPHYSKYDDSAEARGFVESSYINGLSPQELFFHAMGGRIGLIDTAVKTSTTGYIQRRLIKSLEDLMVCYDMTIRSSKGKIVQFSYGDDSIDTIKVENQDLPLLEMSIEDIYAHFALIHEKADSSTGAVVFSKEAFKRHHAQRHELADRTKRAVGLLIDHRNQIVKNIFNYKSDKVVRAPVAFAHLIQNIAGQQRLTSHSMVDLTLLEAFQLIDAAYQRLEAIHFAAPTPLFQTLFYFYLSPKDLLLNKRFSRVALETLLEHVQLAYRRAIVAPGEMVGMIAAQSLGEPTTQMTLNTFHFAGVASKSNVTRGVPRIEELLSLSKNIKNPSLTVFLKEADQTDKDKASMIQHMLEYTKLGSIVSNISICFDPNDMQTLIAEDQATLSQFYLFQRVFHECVYGQPPSTAAAATAATTASTATASTATAAATAAAAEESAFGDTPQSKWIIRMEMNPEEMLDKNITMDDVHFTLNSVYKHNISCVYSDYNADKLIFRIRMPETKPTSAASKKHKESLFEGASDPLDQSDAIFVLKNIQDQLLNNVILKGVKKIKKVILRKVIDNLVEQAGTFKKQDIWVLDTIGVNLLEVLGLSFIDARRTISNDVQEVAAVLGIEAARQCIYNELSEVLEFDGSYVNTHHMALLCDRMTYAGRLIAVFRNGINSDDIGPIAKASFEETPEMFLRAARHAELDVMTGISANVMCGQEGCFGTAAFQVLLDLDEMTQLKKAQKYTVFDEAEYIDKELGGLGDEAGLGVSACRKELLQIRNNVANLRPEELGATDAEYNPF